jgi:hypothetical protein
MDEPQPCLVSSAIPSDQLRGRSAMSLHLYRHSSAALGRLPVSAFAAVAIVLSCAAVGATMGVLFPIRSTQPAGSSITSHDAFKAVSSSVNEHSASAALPIAESDKTTSELENTTNVVPVETTPSKRQRRIGKSPIETDNPCRWSQSADGTLTCSGRMVMLPGAGNALHVRQCGMVFHDKVRFNGIDIHVISKQAKGNPFLLRSPDDWKMNFDAANSTVIKVIFTADTAEQGNVICQFSYHLQKIP